MGSVQVVMLRIIVVQERVIEERVGEGLWFILADLLGGLILLDEDGADTLDNSLAFILRSLHYLPLHFPSMISITFVLSLIRVSPASCRILLHNLFIKHLIKLLSFLSDDPMWKFVFGFVFLVITAALCWGLWVDKSCHFFKERIWAG